MGFLASTRVLFLLLSAMAVARWANTVQAAYNVSYDHRSLIIDGQRKLLISTSIHYPRSVPAMWPGLIQLAKDGGANVIESYVFWNGHELSPNNYYFGGRYDLVKFVKTVQQANMYMVLRIGPFIAAEWNYGGVPAWLHYIPGTVFRTDNEPFKHYMKKFTTYIVNLMKEEKLFASQGGPIILAQIENEYGYYEAGYGEGGKRYALWSGQMALSQKTGVPWIMCQQWDAPYPVINTCNGFYCHEFTPISPNYPKMWTENWPGWFKTFGSRDPHRPVEDVAYAVALFFQKGGSLQNYYMYHGGTNFGRTSGGPFITTSYDYDAPIDEYGLARLPKWGHLKELHEAIMRCEKVMLSSDPTLSKLGSLQEADVYTDTSGGCVAFLANNDDKNDATVQFRNTTYKLPAWSVSILPDCKNVLFNTAKVGSQSSVVEMVPETDLKATKWQVFVEKPGLWAQADFTKSILVDHINTTKDTTDYLWYTTSFNVHSNDISLKNGNLTTLSIESKGHGVHIFINKKYQGSAYGSGSLISFKSETPISLKAGKNEIDLLGITVGLQNAGPAYEWVAAGLASVKINGVSGGVKDLSNSSWVYKIGLQGEHLNLYKGDGLKSANWVSASILPKHRSLTWYKALVDPPSRNEPIGLDMVNMGKGQAWLNGEEIGRYWPRRSMKNDSCVDKCDYRGKFNPDKCDTGCGDPTQRWYHVPRSWFKPSGNVLVILEEVGGDPTQIKFSKRTSSKFCASMSEDHPSYNIKSVSSASSKGSNGKAATARLSCPEKASISAVKFASFGNPMGSCGSYSIGDCHDPNSASVVEQACLNRNECAIELSNDKFDSRVCKGTVRRLAVEVECS